MNEVSKHRLDLFHTNATHQLNLNVNIENKYTYALKKVKRKNQSVYEDFLDIVNETRLDFASVDEKGNLIVKPNGQYEFTPENLKKFQKKLRSLGNEKIDIEPHYITDIPENLSFEMREILTDFIIEREEEEK